MDLFRFTTENGVTDFLEGEAVSGYESISWVERYREAGEFTIKARLSSGMREMLPIGSYISHLRTYEVMVVEDHAIDEDLEEDPYVQITGRSLEAVLLEDRVVGSDGVWSSQVLDVAPYTLVPAPTWQQTATLISGHIQGTLDVDNWVPHVDPAFPSMANSTPTQTREIKYGNLYSRVLELLAIDDCGIKTVRRHSYVSPYAGPNPNTQLWIHRGQDVRDTVIFSSDAGDVVGGKYLWSRRKAKNVALISGEYLRVLYEPPTVPSGAERRILYVEAGDIDRRYEPGVTNATQKQAIVDAMRERGVAELAAHNDLIMQSVDISNLLDYEYRKDYDVGDLVTVRGGYDQQAVMRVTEFAEIEDESGYSAIPTLSHLP